MTFQWKIRYEVCRCMKSCSFHTLTASFVVFQWPPRQNTSKKWKTAGPHITKNMQIADDMKFETILRAPTCSWIKFLVPLRLYGWCTPDLHPAQPKPAFLGRRSGAKWVSPSALQYVPDCKGGWLHRGWIFLVKYSCGATITYNYYLWLTGQHVSFSSGRVIHTATFLGFKGSRYAAEELFCLKIERATLIYRCKICTPTNCI